MDDRYQVIVGNIGTVYSGNHVTKARADFQTYVAQSKAPYGRASQEDVFLMDNGEIADEWTEHICPDCGTCCGYAFRGYCIEDECDTCGECIENCECVEGEY